MSSETPGPGKFARSSSFARSFYQPQADDVNADSDPATAAAAAAAAIESPVRQARRMSRRASRRSMRLSGGSGGGGSSSSGPSRTGSDPMARAAAAAAAAAAFDEDEQQQEHEDGGGGDGNNGFDLPMPPPPSSKERQTSWYQDALLQAGASTGNLSEMLGNTTGAIPTAQSPPIVDGPNTDNDEVLEQYKIMAHLDASQRVYENIGFDPTEYEKRRKADLEADSQQVEYFTGNDKPKPILPETKILPRHMAEEIMYQPREPLLLGSVLDPSQQPLSSTKRRTHALLVEQRASLRLPPSKNPEQGTTVGESTSSRRTYVHSPYVMGNIVRGSTHTIPEGEQAVRCWGCNTMLKVGILTLLLKCPECKTVCPSGSTRT